MSWVFLACLPSKAVEPGPDASATKSRKDGVHFVWMGIGFGGQRLMVFPDEQLIAVFTARDILKDPAFDAKLAERMLPAILVKSCPAGER